MSPLLDNEDTRVAVAFLVAPATVPLAVAVVLWNPIPVMFVTLAYPAAILTGIPAYLLLKSANLLRFWTVAGAGAILGALVGLLTLFRAADAHTLMIQSALFGVYGGITGFVFWLIAIARPRSSIR